MTPARGGAKLAFVDRRSAEIDKRRRAAEREAFAFEALGGGVVRVRSGSGNVYTARFDLAGRALDCSCPDFAGTKLGTCKHLEAAQLFLAGQKPSEEPGRTPPPPRAPPLAFVPRGGEVLVFDLETQRSFDEVPGRRIERLGLSLAVVFAYGRGFTTYREEQADALVQRLAAAELVVGFNHRRFDREVLRPYDPAHLLDRAVLFDLMEDLAGRMGHRVSLDSLARGTLGASKSADGLQALEWYRQGDFAKLEKYCREDVRITRDVWEAGRRDGRVKVPRFAGGRTVVEPVAVEWDAPGLPAPEGDAPKAGGRPPRR